MYFDVGIKKLPGNEDLALPERMSEGASGFDLSAAVRDELRLEPGEWRLVPTGIALEMPTGLEAQVRPRSGLALKHGITLLNSPGTIDADYRGRFRSYFIIWARSPLWSVAGRGSLSWCSNRFLLSG